jgi:hypothetical protein
MRQAREIIHLKFSACFRTREIARRLGIAASTVRETLRRLGSTGLNWPLHGYIALDCVRPAVFGDQRVELWYRQNILMFCLPGRCPSGYMAVRSPYYLDRVDPELFTRVANGPPYSGREALHMLPRIPSVLTRAIIRKIRARL